MCLLRNTLAFIFSICLIGAAVGEERSSIPGANVESVVRLARQLNHDLAASILDADAAAYRVSSAGVQADPTVKLQTWDVNNRGVGQVWIGGQQTLRLWGKTDLEKGVATASADAVLQQSIEIEIDLISRVKTAYVNYFASYRALEISKTLQLRLDQLAEVMRLRYATGSGKQQDLIKADSESANSAVEVARREGEVKAAAAHLNSLIGRKVQAPLAVPSGFPAIKKGRQLSEIQDLARQHNPHLAASQAQIRSANDSKKLADLNYYPDVTAEANVVQLRNGQTDGMFMVGFNVLLHYEAKNAEQRAANANLAATRDRNIAFQIRLDGEVAEAWFRFSAIERAIKIFEQRQRPQSLISVEAARKGYESGNLEFSLLAEEERRLRVVELEFLMLKVEELSKYFELERLAGGSL